MAKQIALEIELNGDKQVLRSMNDMNDAAEQLRMQMEAATDPEDIRRFGRELQKVEGHVKDIELQFESLDIEQRMTAATDVVAGLAGGFAAVEGAIAIAGVESEAFEETMTKVMGAMAFAQGIKDMGTAAVAMKKLTDVTKIQAAAQRVLNFVMSMNPIGLIVTAIGLLIAGIIAFQKPIQNAIAKFESLNGVAKVLIGILAGPLLAAIYGVTKALEFFGVINSKAQNDAISAAEKRRKAEIKAHKERIKELDKEIDALGDQIDQIRKGREAVELRYDREIELARAAGKDTKRLEGEKLDDTIERVRKEIIALEERYRVEQERIRETAELTKKLVADNNVIMTNIYESLQDTREQILSTRAKEVSESKNMLDELLHDREVHEAEVLKAQQDAARKAYEERQKELDKLREQAKNHREEMMEDAQEFLDEIKPIAEETDEIMNVSLDLELPDPTEQTVQYEEAWLGMIDRVRAGLNAFRDEQVAFAMAAEMNAQAVSDSLNAISEIIGKETEKGAKLARAAAVIQVLIDTARSISATIAGAAQAAAAGGPAAPFLLAGYVASGIATVLSSFASVKGILAKANAQTPSLGSATAGATGGARINPVQSGNTQIDANGNSIQDTQEMKVHVVESEISEVQGRVSVIENQAAAR